VNTQDHGRTLLTIVCEKLVAPHLIADLERLGVPGWTATPAHGAGHSGLHEGSWENDANQRIEVVCGAELARTLSDHLLANWYDNYRVVCWLTDVSVLRPQRF